MRHHCQILHLNRFASVSLCVIYYLLLINPCQVNGPFLYPPGHVRKLFHWSIEMNQWPEMGYQICFNVQFAFYGWMQNGGYWKLSPLIARIAKGFRILSVSGLNKYKSVLKIYSNAVQINPFHAIRLLLYLPPENIGKPLVFLYFQRIQEKISGMK